MATVTFRFLKPNSLIGRLIAWRLGEPWSHVCILIEDAAYSAQMPWVVMLPTTDKTVALPPRVGVDVILSMGPEDLIKIKDWCETKVGMDYDFLSIFGWLFGWKWLQNKRNTYCFEYCREALEHMGWLNPDTDLIKGNRLIADIELLISTHVVNLPGTTTIVTISEEVQNDT